MTYRDRLIDEKAKSIQKMLCEWAEKEGFLKLGEQLVFTLEVQEVALVERARKQQDVLDMLVFDFF